MFETVNIYCFNNEQIAGLIPKTTLAANADEIINIPVIQVNLGFENEQETTEYVNGYTSSINKPIEVFELISTYKDYPDAGVDIGTYLYGRILKYNYHYIGFNSYKYLTDVSVSTGIAVNIVNYSIEHNNKSGANKRVSIDLKRRIF